MEKKYMSYFTNEKMRDKKWCMRIVTQCLSITNMILLYQQSADLFNQQDGGENGSAEKRCGA